jgi:hypothetical protein
MYRSLKYLIVGSALSLAALPTLANEESAAVAPERPATAVVKCSEAAGVPMTADEAQALPMHVVTFLACGDTVSVLSDRQGYTLHIRTNNGQDGYVARMYLSDGSAVASATKKAPISSAHVENGIARWVSGAEGCDEFVSHGRHVESITANGITVQVSIQDSGWKLRANVAVSNQSPEVVSILPGIVTLDELTPNLRSLYATDPAKLAHTLAYRTSPAPDYLNPQLELASTRHSGFDRGDSIDVQAIALKSAALPAGQIHAGVMWFERDANAHELSLRVPVGDMVFDFPFSLEQKK